jgi:hypothetical protein
MNTLSIRNRMQILNALSEGVGINAAARMTGKSKNTILKLLADAGAACAAYQDQAMRGLTIKTTPAMDAGVTTYLWTMEDIFLMAETNV